MCVWARRFTRTYKCTSVYVFARAFVNKGNETYYKIPFVYSYKCIKTLFIKITIIITI